MLRYYLRTNSRASLFQASAINDCSYCGTMDHCIVLNDGHRLPTMGFGTFRLQGSSCR